MCKKIRSISASIAVAVVLFFMMSGQSLAMIYSDETFQLTGKLEAKASFFTNDAEGYTYPAYDAWSMFKQRNMMYLQADHNLQPLTGLDLQYHLVGRVIYEGIYDYGPIEYRKAYSDNKDAFDRYNLKLQYALWEAYANYNHGPFNLRIGRQNLSWGEMDVFRVTDHINPLDNTWGGAGTESLDDRRIPLWMIRASYQEVPQFGVEAFLVPGAIDNTVAPWAPYGSPYCAPVPNISALTSALGIRGGWNKGLGAVTEPDRDMSSSRVGLKLSTFMFDSSFALSYQRTYWDLPLQRFRTTTGSTLSLTSPGTFSLELQYPKVNVFALQGNHVFTDIDLIVKGEVAHTQDAPIYIVSLNKPIVIAGLSSTLSPGQFTQRDRTDLGISLEKKFWIRAINNGDRLTFVYEYYGTYYHNYDQRMIWGVPTSAGTFDQMKRYEQVMDFQISSSWYNKWSAAFVTMYDPRGAWQLIPKMSYKFNNPLTVELSYSMVTGVWTNFGFMRDRDQISALLRWEL